MKPADQLDLFASARRDTITARARRRNSDPKTSHEAARAVAPFGHNHHATIHATLLVMVTGTFYEIADRCPLTPQQVWRRLPELEALGMVEVVKAPDGEDVCRPGPSGRRCRVWRVTP